MGDVPTVRRPTCQECQVPMVATRFIAELADLTQRAFECRSCHHIEIAPSSEAES